MANTNCLQGMRCPGCKAEEPFIISVTALVKVYDNGTEDMTDTEWEDDSPCTCEGCGRHGVIKDFQIAKQEISLVRKSKIQELPLLINNLETDEGKKTLEGRLKHARK